MLISFLLISNCFINAKIIQKNRQFIDESGRTRIFHGVNVVYKLPPYIPLQDNFDPFLSFSSEDIKHMKHLGFNLVRLGIMWEAIETSPGIYNETLLDKYTNLVNLLGSHNIYTILDAHQDIFSRLTCGEGVPTFYVKEIDYDKDCNGSLFKRFLHLIGVCKGMSEFNYKTDETGLPLISECQKMQFAFYHTTSDITSLYYKLFTNSGGLLDKFVEFWKVVMKRFSNNPFVIGLDIWNEPFPGGLYDKILQRIIPGKADNDQLLPFYRRIDSALREIDQNFILMYEPNPFPDVLPILNFRFTGNFKDVPLKSEELAEKQMFNFHSYCCQTGMHMCDKGEPPLEQKDYCRNYHLEKFKLADIYTKKFNIGSIVTEFGACFNTEACYNEISSVTETADSYLVSWAYWMYKPFLDFTTSCPDNKEGVFNQDGSYQEFKYKALTRTYVQAFQGKAIKMIYDKDQKILEVLFELDLSIEKPTEIYFNRVLNYPQGYEISHNQEELNMKIDENEENLIKLLFSTKNSEEHKKNTFVVEFIFKPKNALSEKTHNNLKNFEMKNNDPYISDNLSTSLKFLIQ
jgi:endoglycosylceramidase